MQTILRVNLIIISAILLQFSHACLFETQLVAAEEVTQQKTRKTPALRERVYSQLARAQKLADEGNVAEGMEILDRVESRQNQLNSYEKAMLWNFTAFIQYSEENIPEAITAFGKVIEQENIPESLEMSTLFSLAQLSMSIEQYQDTINYLDRWEELAGDKTNRSNAYTLRANALYSSKKYKQALVAIDAGIAESDKDGKLPNENWLVLKRALHYELKQTQLVADTTEQLVRLYSKPKYWVELANLYGELGQDEKHLAVMEAAYQQNFIENGRDFQTLAQLYFYSGAPYKAAKLLDTEITNNTIQADLKMYTFLAQAWEAANELDEAIEVLESAVGLTNDHSLLQKLARLHVDLERWSEALDYANQAEKIIEHVENPGNVYIAKGIALLNLKRFDESISAFEKAKNITDTKRVATEWLRFVERESELHDAIQVAMDVSE